MAGVIAHLMEVRSASTRCDLAALTAIASPAAIQPWAEMALEWQTQVARSVMAGGAIAATVAPTTAEELAEVMTAAYGAQWRVLIAGGGSKLDWGGPVAQPDLVLSTVRLNRLIDHAVGDLTVTAEAGIRFADVQSILLKENQTLAFDPAYPEQATLGGIVATGDTGSLRQRYNGVRDMLLGITFVRSDGQIAKAGGRVVKNVAGYDLMKLFTGSYGTLGVLTQMTLRVYPLPEASRTIVLTGAVQALDQITRTLLSSALTPLAADLVAGTTLAELGLPGTLGLALRFQTIQSSVDVQTSRMAAVAETLGLAIAHFADDSETMLWQQLRSRIPEAPRDRWITCKVGVKSTAAVTVLQQIGELAPAAWLAQIHGASGLGKLALDANLPPETVQKIRELFNANQGFLSVLQAPVAWKQGIDVWGYTGNALDLMQQLKYQFDPHNLLNPQRFVGGI
jgi:glycolate oxidase FAD binding subunit